MSPQDAFDVPVVRPRRLRGSAAVRRMVAETRLHPAELILPAFVREVPDLPRTISGKLSEIAVRNVINGLPLKNAGALANPDSLEFFRGVALG